MNTLQDQTHRLQHIQNALARTVVVQAPKFQHITLFLKSLHWLKVSERIEYKIILFSHKILSTTQPPYSMTLYLMQPPQGSQHTLFTSCHSDQTTIIVQSHSPLLLTCFTSSLEPAIPTSLRIPHPNIIIHPPLSDNHLNMPV